MIGVNFGSLRELWRFPVVGGLLGLCAERQADTQQKNAKPARMEY